MEPEALARQVIAKLRGAGHQAYLVGGCVRDLLLGVKPKDFDVATDARPDHLDGRHPEQVRFECDPREDVLRRDFTINGLMMDPDDRRVLDFVEGQKDLQYGIIRAIGDPYARFREDHLRLMRAIRFAARFGFTIEPATMDAIRRDHSLILKVSVERV